MQACSVGGLRRSARLPFAPSAVTFPRPLTPRPPHSPRALTARSRSALRSPAPHSSALSLPPHRAAGAQQHSRPGASCPANRGSRHLLSSSGRWAAPRMRRGARRRRSTGVLALSRPLAEEIGNIQLLPAGRSFSLSRPWVPARISASG